MARVIFWDVRFDIVNKTQFFRFSLFAIAIIQECMSSHSDVLFFGMHECLCEKYVARISIYIDF